MAHSSAGAQHYPIRKGLEALDAVVRDVDWPRAVDLAADLQRELVWVPVGYAPNGSPTADPDAELIAAVCRFAPPEEEPRAGPPPRGRGRILGRVDRSATYRPVARLWDARGNHVLADANTGAILSAQLRANVSTSRARLVFLTVAALFIAFFVSNLILTFGRLAVRLLHNLDFVRQLESHATSMGWMGLIAVLASLLLVLWPLWRLRQLFPQWLSEPTRRLRDARVCVPADNGPITLLRTFGYVMLVAGGLSIITNLVSAGHLTGAAQLCNLLATSVICGWIGIQALQLARRVEARRVAGGRRRGQTAQRLFGWLLVVAGVAGVFAAIRTLQLVARDPNAENALYNYSASLLAAGVVGGVIGVVLVRRNRRSPARDAAAATLAPHEPLTFAQLPDVLRLVINVGLFTLAGTLASTLYADLSASGFTFAAPALVGSELGATVGVLVARLGRDRTRPLVIAIVADAAFTYFFGEWSGVMAGFVGMLVPAALRGSPSSALRLAWAFTFAEAIGRIGGRLLGLLLVGPAGMVLGEVLLAHVAGTAAYAREVEPDMAPESSGFGR